MSQNITYETSASTNSLNNEKLKEKTTHYNGYAMMQKTCFNCGRTYFIPKQPMSICTMPCPFCGVDLCNPTC